MSNMRRNGYICESFCIRRICFFQLLYFHINSSHIVRMYIDWWWNMFVLSTLFDMMLYTIIVFRSSLLPQQYSRDVSVLKLIFHDLCVCDFLIVICKTSQPEIYLLTQNNNCVTFQKQNKSCYLVQSCNNSTKTINLMQF